VKAGYAAVVPTPVTWRERRFCGLIADFGHRAIRK
jgi:hypothetical protein